MSNNEMRFDFDGLIQLLARNLYSEKDVFIRELIQNAHDSIQRRKQQEPGFGGRIDIETRPDELLFIVRDNGIGMNQHDIVEYLSTVGRGATREEKAAGTQHLIGQFGIGFLSAFVVAEKVEVRTRKLDDSQAWLWCNSGSKNYELVPCDYAEVGTEVRIHLKSAAEKGVIHEETVQKVIRHYADMLAIPIHLNRATAPVNSITMPWEQNRSADELAVDCLVYLEKHMRDSVLEVIPIDLNRETHGIQASGVLYITRTRVIATDAPRTVRVFVQRMYLCENSEVLPKWAQFVNGIVNTSDLTPTAARDNFVRDAQASQLKEALGNLIIGHLDRLHQEKPERFSQILRYHDLNIKAACHYYDEFFKKFVHLLEWRTNVGKEVKHSAYEPPSRTLGEIIKLLPGEAGSEKKLPYFSDRNAANQYFRMADAAGSMVVDASYPFENQLLKAYARLPDVRVQLIAVDRQDDPNVFRHLEEDDEQRVSQLAERMSQVIRPGAHGTIRVEARRFQPADLAAVIRSTERSRAQSKAEDMLNDPNLPEDLREMAREMSVMSRRESLRLVINADNSLIQKLAQQDFDHPDVLHLMFGVYNNAILHNAELMTPDNARVFHEQFQELLHRSLEYIAGKAELESQREVLQQQQAAQRQKNAPRASHRIFFLMFPFEGYSELESALREVVEDRWGCQLYIASDRQWEDTIWGNIRAHMDKADAFIAEISEATPNVMFELGAVAYQMGERPTVLLRHGKKTDKASVPADLRGFVYLDYAEQGDKSLVDFLDDQMRRKDGIKMLLDGERERYLSPSRLKALSRIPHIPDTVFQVLADRYPTRESWRVVDQNDIRKELGSDSDLADVLIRRIKGSQ